MYCLLGSVVVHSSLPWREPVYLMNTELLPLITDNFKAVVPGGGHQEAHQGATRGPSELLPASNASLCGRGQQWSNLSRSRVPPVGSRFTFYDSRYFLIQKVLVSFVSIIQNSEHRQRYTDVTRWTTCQGRACRRMSTIKEKEKKRERERERN